MSRPRSYDKSEGPFGRAPCRRCELGHRSRSMAPRASRPACHCSERSSPSSRDRRPIYGMVAWLRGQPCASDGSVSPIARRATATVRARTIVLDGSDDVFRQSCTSIRGACERSRRGRSSLNRLALIGPGAAAYLLSANSSKNRTISLVACGPRGSV